MNQHNITLKLFIYEAAEQGNLERVQSLLESGEVSIETFDGILTKRTALHYAVEGGQVDMVEFLLSKGASITTIDACGFDALLLAIEQGNSEITRLLLAHETIELNNVPRGYLDRAARLGDAEVINQLLQYGAKPPTGILHQAVYGYQPASIRILYSDARAAERVRDRTPIEFLIDCIARSDSSGFHEMNLARAIRCLYEFFKVGAKIKPEQVVSKLHEEMFPGINSCIKVTAVLAEWSDCLGTQLIQHILPKSKKDLGKFLLFMPIVQEIFRQRCKTNYRKNEADQLGEKFTPESRLLTLPLETVNQVLEETVNMTYANRV